MTTLSDDAAPAHSPEALRTRRTAARLTQAQLAAMAGVTQPYLSLLEYGDRSPGLRTLCKLARALGCTAGDLMPAPAPGGGHLLRHDPSALRQARKDAKLTQVALARRASISQPYLSMLECGTQTPGEELLATLARFCGVTADSLRAGRAAR